MGPCPTRSKTHPRGFEWLQGHSLKQAQLANTLVDFTFAAALAQSHNNPGLLVIEFPEDLGAITSGTWKGVRPSSIWQWPQFRDMVNQGLVWTAGIKQQDFGTPYVKPTRLCLRMNTSENPALFMGLPDFDNEGFYLGPIPKGHSAFGLAKKQGEQGFRTSGTAAWPPALCKFLAEQLHVSAQTVSPGFIDDVLDHDIKTDTQGNTGIEGTAQPIMEPGTFLDWCHWLPSFDHFGREN